jgi:hypothetical protein
MAKTKRIFLAHSKSDDNVLALVEKTQKLAESMAAAGVRIEVISGRDHHMANFRRCGSWDSWAREVATGVHPITREPRFDMIVVPAGPLGKATKEICEHALGASKPVLILDSGVLLRASRVVTVDSQDFKSGWRLT